MFSIRKECIFCNTILNDTFLKNDFQIPIACYCKEDNLNNSEFIPYNVHTCLNCKTSQTKYLGDLNLIYKINHADSTGAIMENLHKTVSELVKKHANEITNITEIGCSKGLLSSIILNEISQINKYYIIEPQFIGNKHSKQVIINDFFENVDYSKYIDSNTIIISHVFEHFYDPLNILDVIKNNKNVENMILVWPDLEYYKNNNNYHVLNTEHTFYIDNSFVKKLFNNHSFEMLEEIFYENHSVIYFFKRNDNLICEKLINVHHSIDNYFNNILNKKEEIYKFIQDNKNKNKKICIWPASVHTQFLIMLLEITEFDYVLDNSVNKIGKYLYGYNLECKSLQDNFETQDFAIILNGGVFNKEVKNNIKIHKTQIFVNE